MLANAINSPAFLPKYADLAASRLHNLNVSLGRYVLELRNDIYACGARARKESAPVPPVNTVDCDERPSVFFELSATIDQSEDFVINFQRNGIAALRPNNCSGQSTIYGSVSISCYSYSGAGAIIYNKDDALTLHRITVHRPESSSYSTGAAIYNRNDVMNLHGDH
jgi:hypothetical protein